MAYVVDTHALIWFLTDNKSVGNEARSILRKADENEEMVIIPTIVLAEAFYICEKKRIGTKFKDILERIEKSLNYVSYDLDLEIILKLEELGKIKELHDRIIVATALLTNSKILTKDKNIIDSKYVGFVW